MLAFVYRSSFKSDIQLSSLSNAFTSTPESFGNDFPDRRPGIVLELTPTFSGDDQAD